MGDRTRLCHVDRIARYRQASRHDVAESDHLGDLSLQCHLQHAIEVSIGDQKSTVKRFERVLGTARDEELKRNRGRIICGELADVGYNSETFRTVHAVNADDVAAANVRADQSD